MGPISPSRMPLNVEVEKMGDLRKLVVGIRMSDDDAQMVPPPRRQARGIISILFG
ncbi:hypothetical protein NC652_022732 [Populus alba x Populus x berolinensis]|nr:hypothetical protein NC652_022439 [Populus alba x Populus x berolinensis]KAJ6904749.1 hypothetical protein NC652_022701 [Populus alba x Populus x berolinensis]KAJ6904789.1 hypothetical protein NC652_022732 [Populus alba x Populus x berolinensis]